VILHLEQLFYQFLRSIEDINFLLSNSMLYIQWGRELRRFELELDTQFVLPYLLSNMVRIFGLSGLIILQRLADIRKYKSFDRYYKPLQYH